MKFNKNIDKVIIRYNKNIDKVNRLEKKKALLLKKLLAKLKIDKNLSYSLDGGISKLDKIKKKELDEEDIQLLLENEYNFATGETIPNFFTKLQIFSISKENIASISFDDKLKPHLYFHGNFAVLPSHLEMRKDIDFMNTWKNKKIKKLEKQNTCPKCEEYFDKNKRDKVPTLHHTKTEEKQENFSKIIDRLKKDFLNGKKTISDVHKTASIEKERYIDCYKSLSDTELICLDCHSKKEHPEYIIRSIYNKYCRKINGAKEGGNSELVKKLKEDYYFEMEKHGLFNDENNKWIELLSNEL